VNTSTLIFEKMAAIQAELEPVGKDRSAPGLNFKYRGIDDAMAALNPLLAKHQVFLLPEYQPPRMEEAGKTNSGKPQVRAVTQLVLWFVASDGSRCCCQVPGEGIDTADKAVMKSLANAMKYAIYNTFCIPTEEKKDSEAFGEEEAPKSAPRKRTPAAPPTAKKGITDKIAAAASLDDLNALRPEVREAIQRMEVEADKQALSKVFHARAEELGQK
jgi:hypothetical protein